MRLEAEPRPVQPGPCSETLPHTTQEGLGREVRPRTPPSPQGDPAALPETWRPTQCVAHQGYEEHSHVGCDEDPLVLLRVQIITPQIAEKLVFIVWRLRGPFPALRGDPHLGPWGG